MKCQQATELISLSCDQQLNLLQQMRLPLHLWICPKCRNFQHNTKRLGHILKGYCHHDKDESR